LFREIIKIEIAIVSIKLITMKIDDVVINRVRKEPTRAPATIPALHRNSKALRVSALNFGLMFSVRIASRAGIMMLIAKLSKRAANTKK